MTQIRLDVDDVKSSNIHGITFFADRDSGDFLNHSSILGTLLVEYVTGDVYKYYDVHFGVILNVLSQQSIGGSIKKNLKNYRYEKVVLLNDIQGGSIK